MEVEIKLNVKPAIAGGPIALFTKLTLMKQIAGRPLGPVKQIEIYDLYYDTEDGALAKAGVGLRSRVANGHGLVTLKIDQYEDGALTQREEFEEPLTQGRFDWVLSHIRHLIGDVPTPVELFAGGKPCGSLNPQLKVGTARLTRSIANKATLTLDMVEYPVYSSNPYFDIEIESALGDAGKSLIRDVETELHKLAGGDLAPAKMNKLERGLKLQTKFAVRP